MKILRLFLVLMIFVNCTEDGVELVNTIVNPKADLEIKKIFNLPSVLDETSGLINFNGRIITHNDGKSPKLYEIDSESGMILRTVEVDNITARDIEDISQDDDHIYLADIGNNSNTRTDLTIYKIDKSAYLNHDHVSAELIEISYKNQIDFSKSNNSTNFDAEAIIALEDFLYLFTKNWNDLRTSVYRIPKIKGEYVLEVIDDYNVDGLITGASYSENNNTIVLTGYRGFSPFIVILSEFPIDNPLGGKFSREKIIVSGSVQIEGIAANPNGSFYLSAERNSGLAASIYELKFN